MNEYIQVVALILIIIFIFLVSAKILADFERDENEA